MPVFSKVKVLVQVEETKLNETFLINTDSLTVIDAYLADQYAGYDILKKQLTTGLNFEDVIINEDSMAAENAFYLCKWNITEEDEKGKLKTTQFKSIIESTSVEKSSAKMTDILSHLTNAVVVNVADSKIVRIVDFL